MTPAQTDSVTAHPLQLENWYLDVRRVWPRAICDKIKVERTKVTYFCSVHGRLSLPWRPCSAHEQGLFFPYTFGSSQGGVWYTFFTLINENKSGFPFCKHKAEKHTYCLFVLIYSPCHSGSPGSELDGMSAIGWIIAILFKWTRERFLEWLGLAVAQVFGLACRHTEPSGRKSLMLPANKSLNLFGQLFMDVQLGLLGHGWDTDTEISDKIWLLTLKVSWSFLF